MASKGDSKDKDGKGGGIMPLIIAAVLSIVIGVGAGYGTIVTFAPPKTPEAAAKPATPPAADAKAAEAPAKDAKAAGGHGAEEDASRQARALIDEKDLAEALKEPRPDQRPAPHEYRGRSTFRQEIRTPDTPGMFCSRSFTKRSA